MSWLPWLLLGFVAGDYFSSWHDASDLERDDENRRWEHDFGTTQLYDQEERDRVLRQTDGGQVEE